MNSELTMRSLRRCFDGRIPAIICTVSSSGQPNITYLSAVHQVDDERVALSNQFMSKTSRNLAENPRASLTLIDPVSFSEYRLAIRYERTDRRGPVFERLRDDVDKVAALSGMRDIFRLRSADICRVEGIELVFELDHPADEHERQHSMLLAASAELAGRMSRCADLESLMSVALQGLDELLGYRHSSVMLLDEQGTRLFTIASHGFPTEGVGSEVELGEGVAGNAAEKCQAVRVGQMRHVQKYMQTVRREYERDGAIGPGLDVPLPTLVDAQSSVAVPAMVRGELVGVVVVDSPLPLAFEEEDESVLTLVAALIAQMVDVEGSSIDSSERATATPGPRETDQPSTGETHVRFFAEDGSIFLDGEYLIRGVAGRILWSLVQRHDQTGQTEFANKELRLDRSLELPGFRDNLDTRLVMLKRRLDERDAPIRLDRTGRGRFRLHLATSLRLEAHQ